MWQSRGDPFINPPTHIRETQYVILASGGGLTPKERKKKKERVGEKYRLMLTNSRHDAARRRRFVFGLTFEWRIYKQDKILRKEMKGLGHSRIYAIYNKAFGLIFNYLFVSKL